MKLGTTELPGATMTTIAPAKKLTVYEYLWTDANYVEESGLAPRTVTVSGTVNGTTERDAVEQACEATGVKKLYFPSINGATDDRYYNVYTQPAQFSPLTGTLYSYSFECVCADSAVYLTADDTAVW